MAVITLYFRSLLVFLIGLSSLVQGGSLLLPRDPQSVAKPVRFPGSSADSIAQASSEAERQPFRGFGYLRVWTGFGPRFLEVLDMGFRPVGWLNKNGEWTFDIKERGVFNGAASKAPYGVDTALIRSEVGMCFIWKENNRRLDCPKMPESFEPNSKIGDAIRVEGDKFVQAFRASKRPTKGKLTSPVVLTALDGFPTGRRVVIQWVPADKE